ncbi:hypothetical protein BAZMOX_19223_2 [methanotrophic endosymbiont of Bathymodiolus azoricus (Menez Gwen)]|nr:hypothetical protein BAZMOX_19223_2 [methanotrophic endosymbiont of Bathymodiolus azoricus (Menez Gwen)]
MTAPRDTNNLNDKIFYTTTTINKLGFKAALPQRQRHPAGVSGSIAVPGGI